MAWNESWRYRDCPWCGVRDVAMNNLGGPAMITRSDGQTLHWHGLACPRCGKPVIIRHSPTASPDHEPLDVVPADPRSSLDVKHLPEDVASYYRDAQVVLDSGVPDAAAVQLRRTLEAAAAHFGINEGPLIKRVEALIAQGLVTKTFGQVLHHVRRIGNLGAHATDERIDDETARRVLSFTTQVLRNLFEIPAELAAAGQASGSEESSTV